MSKFNIPIWRYGGTPTAAGCGFVLAEDPATAGNYYSPMHNLFNSPNLLQPALQNQATWSGHLSNASQVTSRSELGGIRDDRPAGWATINSVDNPQTFSQLANNQLTQGSAFNQGYFIYQYSEDGVGKLFLVLSPDQQAFHCMGNCVNTP